MPPRIDKHTLSQLISEHTAMDWDSFSQTDWALLLHSAQQEGIGPLLYWRLSKSGKFASIPEDARNSLRAMYSGTWMHNQQIFKELEVLARLFNQANIPAVVLKGACFALTIYPDIGLRPMGDLDILVPKANLAEAVQIAKTFGYYVDAKPETSPDLKDLLRHHVCLQKTGKHSIALEIHHNLAANKSFTFAVPVDWFWSQTEPLIAASSQTRFESLRMLTPAAQILYAAAHAMLQHGGKEAPLRWFYDLDRLIRFYAGRMDWDLILSQAGRFEWGSALDAALSQTYTYFNTPIPDHVRASLSKSSDRHKALVALMKIKPATYILSKRQKLLSLNWYGRFRLVLALFAPAPAYMRWRYQFNNSWMLPVYYLIRWWGILKDAIQTLLHLAKKPLTNRP